jgi:hypothetical protein
MEGHGCTKMVGRLGTIGLPSIHKRLQHLFSDKTWMIPYGSVIDLIGSIDSLQ